MIPSGSASSRAMIFTETRLRGAFVLDLERREDGRGFFARTFCRREFAEHGLKPEIAQASVTFTKTRGTLRGMHFQFPPAAETKVISVTRGAVLDIIVDLRPESPTFLQHVAVELTSENRRSLYIPERFVHGYQTLADDTETSYLIGDFYTPAAESGLPYSDPALGLTWPLPVSEISSRDAAWTPFAEVERDVRRRMAVLTAR
jgi:dTDP-4-dehydrorhamnose 3,5-epimerase